MAILISSFSKTKPFSICFNRGKMQEPKNVSFVDSSRFVSFYSKFGNMDGTCCFPNASDPSSELELVWSSIYHEPLKSPDHELLACKSQGCDVTNYKILTLQ